MNRQELIAKLKKNERASCFLSNEEKELMRELVKKEEVEMLSCYGDWREAPSEFDDPYDGYIYRIHPDYEEPEPEPEFVECDVRWENGFYYYHWKYLEACNALVLQYVPNGYVFAGCKFKGQHYNDWVMCREQCIDKHGFLNLACPTDSRWLPATPVKIRFMRKA